MIWKIMKHLKTFIIKCRKDNISAFAAQSAFFILLSLIPFLMVFSSLIQYTVVSEGMLLSFINEFFPQYISPFMISVVNEVYQRSIGIVSITAFVAIWSAARGIQHMAAGLNAVNGIKETRNWFVRRFCAVMYTIIFLFAIVFVMILLVFGNVFQKIVLEHVQVLIPAVELFFRFRGLITFGVLSCLFTVLYRTLPNNKEIKNHKLTLRNQFPGGVLCASIWYLLSFGISVYLDYFNGFSMYGSLTTIVLVMLWLYFGMYIMLLSAKLNLMFGERIRKKIELYQKKD